MVALRGGLRFLDGGGQVAFGQFGANAQLGKQPSVSPDAFRLVSDLLDLSVTEQSGAPHKQRRPRRHPPFSRLPTVSHPKVRLRPRKWPPATQWLAASDRTSTLMITPS